MSLIKRILIGLVIGALLGLFAPQLTAIGILGKVFVNALKAIAPLLVFVLVSSSISKAGSGLGPRFRTVIGLYIVSTLCAALVAVSGSTLFPISLQLSDVAEGSAPAQFIGTLFKEDFALYDSTIAALNELNSLDEAVAYVKEHFPQWNLGSDVAYRFMMAIRKKLG